MEKSLVDKNKLEVKKEDFDTKKKTEPTITHEETITEDSEDSFISSGSELLSSSENSDQVVLK